MCVFSRYLIVFLLCLLLLHDKINTSYSFCIPSKYKLIIQNNDPKHVYKIPFLHRSAKNQEPNKSCPNMYRHKHENDTLFCGRTTKTQNTHMPLPNNDIFNTINHHTRNCVTPSTLIANTFSNTCSPCNNTTNITYQKICTNTHHEHGHVTTTAPKPNTLSPKPNILSKLFTMPDTHHVTYNITSQHLKKNDSVTTNHDSPTHSLCAQFILRDIEHNNKTIHLAPLSKTNTT
jgi:hypothetical protein